MVPAGRSSAVRLSFPAASLALVALAFAPPVFAAPLIGFVEDWPGVSTGTWFAGASLSNPGADGAGGAGDGYLSISTSVSAHLGAASDGAEYAGDWIAAGIDKVRLWLRDTGDPQALEIHFGIGSSANFWQCNTGFEPPADGWAEFTVDLSSGAGWTRIIGSGNFAGPTMPYQVRPLNPS